MTKKTMPAPRRAGTATDEEVTAELTARLRDMRATDPEMYQAVLVVISRMVEKKSSKS